MSGELFIVGTPIGNLGDLSLRAAKTLEEVDFIAAEDTRVSLKLLNHLGIKKPMVSYFEHNKRERGEVIAARILAGESCALVTDAGMPAISDPGEDLAALCHEKGIKINAVPGPTAFATALALSGLPTGRFCFEGFLSVSNKSRAAHLESIREETRTLVFYEAPHKLARTLADLYATLGNRQIAIVREITKIHEEVIRSDLETASRDYADGHLKGEIVLIIAGKAETEAAYSLKDALEIAQSYIADGLSKNDAAKQAAKETKIKKSEIYKELTKQ